jgi:GH43 family beta-xylosidase
MLRLGVLVTLLSVLVAAVWGEQFTNPLRKKDGSDPWITFNTADKHYYLLTTTWRDVQITRARTLSGLKTGEKRVVYKDGNVNRCCNVWAPGMEN